MRSRTLFKTPDSETIYFPNEPENRPDNPVEEVWGGYVIRIEGEDDDVQEFIELSPIQGFQILQQYLQQQLGRDPEIEDFEAFEAQNRHTPVPASAPLGNRRVSAPFPADARDHLGSDSD